MPWATSSDVVENREVPYLYHGYRRAMTPWECLTDWRTTWLYPHNQWLSIWSHALSVPLLLIQHYYMDYHPEVAGSDSALGFSLRCMLGGYLLSGFLSANYHVWHACAKASPLLFRVTLWGDCIAATASALVGAMPTFVMMTQPGTYLHWMDIPLLFAMIAGVIRESSVVAFANHHTSTQEIRVIISMLVPWVWALVHLAGYFLGLGMTRSPKHQAVVWYLILHHVGSTCMGALAYLCFQAGLPQRWGWWRHHMPSWFNSHAIWHLIAVMAWSFNLHFNTTAAARLILSS